MILGVMVTVFHLEKQIVGEQTYYFFMIDFCLKCNKTVNSEILQTKAWGGGSSDVYKVLRVQ